MGKGMKGDRLRRRGVAPPQPARGLGASSGVKPQALTVLFCSAMERFL